MKKKIVKKYFLIDNNIIKENCIYPFNIYKINNDEIKLLIKNGQKFFYEGSFNYERKLYIYDIDKKLYTNYLKTLSFLNEKKEVFKNATNIIEDMFSNPELLRNQEEIKNTVNSLIETIFDDNFTLSLMFELLHHDYYTHTHSLNVSVLSISLGKKMGLDKNTLEDLATSALLHDLGKAKIDKKILNKNGRLSSLEFTSMKKHPEYGYSFAKEMGIKNKAILLGIRSHHEKIDGTGYPDGLKDEEIHFFAKIIGICDIFDALTTKRVYKGPMGIFETFLLMKKNMKNKLDMNIIDKFILLLKDEN